MLIGGETILLNCGRQIEIASVNFCPYGSDTITAINYLLADFELHVFFFFLSTLDENEIILKQWFQTRKMTFVISRFTPHLMKSVDVACLWSGIFFTETYYHFPDSIFANLFLPSQQQGYRQQIPLNFLSLPSEPRAMPLVKIMPGGNFGHQMSLESFVTLALVSAPTCVSVCI